MHRFFRILLGTVLFVAVVAVAVGATVAFGYDRPTIEGVESHVVGVNATTTLVETHLTVSNPNPVGFRLGETTVNHTVWMNGVEMGTGTERGLRIGRGTTDVTLRTAVDNRKIPTWWVRHVESGERSRVETDLRVSVPVFGRVATDHETSTVRTNVTERLNSSSPRPVNTSLPLLPNPVLVVDRTRATWGTVTHNATPLDTRITVENPTSVPLALARLEYTVTMNGVIVGNGTTDRGTTLPPGEHRTIRSEAVIRNARLDDWWVTHVRRGQRTDLRVAFVGVFTLPNGDTVRMPLRGFDYTATIRTHVFETNATDSSDRSERRGPSDGFEKGEHKSTVVSNPMA